MHKCAELHAKKQIIRVGMSIWMLAWRPSAEYPVLDAGQFRDHVFAAGCVCEELRGRVATKREGGRLEPEIEFLGIAEDLEAELGDLLEGGILGGVGFSSGCHLYYFFLG
jgi:hypothetical protein